MARASQQNGARELYAARELVMSNGQNGHGKIAARQAVKTGFREFELVAIILGGLIKIKIWDRPALGHKRTWDE